MRLFDRTSKGAVPTRFGRVVIERGEALLRDAQALRREVDLLAGLGWLHLSGSKTRCSRDGRTSASPVSVPTTILA